MEGMWTPLLCVLGRLHQKQIKASDGYGQTAGEVDAGRKTACGEFNAFDAKTLLHCIRHATPVLVIAFLNLQIQGLRWRRPTVAFGRAGSKDDQNIRASDGLGHMKHIDIPG